VSFVLATANPDKAAEIRDILRSVGVSVRARPAEIPEVPEDAESLEANALVKARAICEATGSPAIADDTGLFVDALGGAPGVLSARFAGPRATYADNVDRLLRELARVTSDRRARFRTVAAVAYPDGSWFVVDGELDGQITVTARGDGGFGYDPVFAPDGEGGRTLAELSASEKNAISHRGRAFRALADALESR
jgi:XTP/dITP diphosphohydrolase